MIRLELGLNTIGVTLTEKTTIDSPVYLFEFINCQSKEKVYCIAEDLSVYPDRYNKFEITVKTSPDNLNGEIEVNISDQYDYNVYAQTSTTNLDPELADEVVEIGITNYDKAMTERAEYTSTETTRKVYEPTT